MLGFRPTQESRFHRVEQHSSAKPPSIIVPRLLPHVTLRLLRRRRPVLHFYVQQLTLKNPRLLCGMVGTSTLCCDSPFADSSKHFPRRLTFADDGSVLLSQCSGSALPTLKLLFIVYFFCLPFYLFNSYSANLKQANGNALAYIHRKKKRSDRVGFCCQVFLVLTYSSLLGLPLFGASQIVLRNNTSANFC